MDLRVTTHAPGTAATPGRLSVGAVAPQALPATRSPALPTASPGPFRLAGLVLQEARPRVVGIFGLRFVAGALVSGGSVRIGGFLAGLLAWLLVVIAVYVLNGYSDVDGDRLNGSTRPIASGRLGLRAARGAIGLATVGALAIAAAISADLLWHVCAALLLGAAYSLGSQAGKSRPITCAVTVICGGLLTYHAGLLASGGEVTAEYVCFSLALSLWMAVGGVVKDLPDVAGDVAMGRDTVAATRGVKATMRVAAVIAITVALGLGFSAWFLRDLTWPAVVVVVGMSVLLVEAVQWRRLQSRGQEARPYRAFMLTQYGAHVGLV